jgi:hypothetical protein
MTNYRKRCGWAPYQLHPPISTVNCSRDSCGLLFYVRSLCAGVWLFSATSLSLAQNPKVLSRTLFLACTKFLSLLFILFQNKIYLLSFGSRGYIISATKWKCWAKKDKLWQDPPLIKTARLLYKFCDHLRSQNFACCLYGVDRRYSWGGP